MASSTSQFIHQVSPFSFKYMFDLAWINLLPTEVTDIFPDLLPS